jgi:hypothetical protein
MYVCFGDTIKKNEMDGMYSTYVPWENVRRKNSGDRGLGGKIILK